MFIFFFVGYSFGYALTALEATKIKTNAEYRGYIVKEADRGIVAKVYTSGVLFSDPHYIYVYCATKLCPALYTDVVVQVTSTKKLGKYDGFGTIKESEVMASEWYVQFLHSGAQERLIIFNAFAQKYGKEVASLGISMLIGETELDPDLKNVMKDFGILHTIAISGINITYLFLLLSVVTKRLPGYVRAVITYLVIVGLFFFVGESVSLFRAMVTFVLLDIAWKFGVKVAGVDIVAVSFSVLLMVDHNYIADAGFWLTFSACFGIYVIVPIAISFLKVSNSFFIEVMTALLVWLAVLPVQWLFFGQFQVIGIVAGLVVSPLVELASLAGYSYIVSFLLLRPLSEYLGALLAVITGLILFLVDMFHNFYKGG